jgi:shikimate kinase
MKEKKIFLIGFMGSGKSSVSKIVAGILNIPAFDTDDLIEIKAEKPIADLFKIKGENHFRNLEGEVLTEIIALSNPCIISTGGGLPCYFDRMNLLKENGITIYLKCSPEIIYNRIQNEIEKRPLIEIGTKDETIDFIYKKIESRKKIYEAANYIIDGNSKIEDVAQMIETIIRQLEVE